MTKTTKQETMSLWKSADAGDPWMVWDPSVVLTPEESLTLFWETYPAVRWELAPAFGNDVDILLRHAPSACAAWPPSWDDYSEWTKRQKAATECESLICGEPRDECECSWLTL
jgi:hypothetical protein